MMKGKKMIKEVVLDNNFWGAVIGAIKIADISCIYFGEPSSHYQEMIDFINEYCMTKENKDA